MTRIGQQLNQVSSRRTSSTPVTEVKQIKADHRFCISRYYSSTSYFVGLIIFRKYRRKLFDGSYILFDISTCWHISLRLLFIQNKKKN